MRRSVKIGILAVALVLAAGLILVLSPATRRKVKSVLTSSRDAATQNPAISLTAASASLAGSNGSCDDCIDACIQSYGLTQQVMSHCDEICYDECHPKTGGGKNTTKKYKYKLKPH